MLAATIATGTAALGLQLDAERKDRLARYLNLLAKWNHVYNLTGIHNATDMVGPLLLDSLSVHAYVKGPRILDVGSGAGLPGIPLAIADPDAQFVLLDTNGKKTRFMQQALIELRLPNVRVEQDRIESYQPQAGFDTVICRAFAGLTKFVVTAAHACRPQGRLLAMKAALSIAEQRALSVMSKPVAIYKLEVPGIEAERQLVEILNT
jgi:16S rRNA (guanine527-N7)-methyltransferase